MAENQMKLLVKTLLEEVLQEEIRPALENLAQAEQDNRRIFRMMAEMVAGLEELSKFPRAVTVFGSARIHPQDDLYRATRRIAQRFAEEGFAVISGGGPGIMEAANRGAAEGKGASIGLNISLPHEQSANKYSNTQLNFHYFFIRKYMFVKYAKALVIMPGGLGTMDELYEALTLKQTGKMQKFPIVLYDTSYFGGLLDWMRENMVKRGYIDAEDMDLLTITDDPDEVVDRVARYWKGQKAPYVTFVEHDEFVQVPPEEFARGS